MALILTIRSPMGSWARSLAPGQLSLGSAADVDIRVRGGDVAPRWGLLHVLDDAIRLEPADGGPALSLSLGGSLQIGSIELHLHAAEEDGGAWQSLQATPTGRLALQGQGQGSQRYLDALISMANSVGSELSYGEVLDKLMEIVIEVVGPERAVLAFAESDGSLRLEATRRADGEERSAELHISGTILQRVIRSGEAFVTDDALLAPEMAQVQSIAAKQIRSAMCAPFYLRGHVAGALYVDHRRATHRFDAGDLDFLVLLAHLASVAAQNVLDYQRLRAENARLSSEGDHDLVGASPAIREVRRLIEKIAPSNQPVLITGERGTGKELVARAIHRRSGRGPFVAVNCAAIPESLAESILFGHERGAFTGADRRHHGHFELADGGTLFLDEIGDLKGPAQAAILRALQEGEIRRVGALETLRVDVRVVAATNRDLSDAISAGAFRGDLLDRLAVLPIALPPLRERRDDIQGLIAHFAGDRIRRVSARALRLLESHAWPGNVRELRNVVERAVVLGDGQTIWPEDLPPALRDGQQAHQHLATLEALERDHILRVMRHVGGNVSEAGRILGIRRATVYKKLKSYGHEAEEFKER